MGAGGPGGRRAVFLDRDGIINHNVLNPATGELEAPLTAAEFRIIAGVPDALRRLRKAGFLLFLVSNQPNVAKRKASLAEVEGIHSALCRELTHIGVKFTAFYYCLHHPDGLEPGYSSPCACRKPSPYFLLRAAEEFGVDLARSWMIGDRTTDVLCGRAAGVRTVLIGGFDLACEPAPPDSVAEDLAAAARWICATPESSTQLQRESICVGGDSDS